jgi:tetraacyldisaccharide 4'-kinase
VVFTERGEPVPPRVTVRNPFSVTVRLSLGDAVNLRSGERRPLDAFRGREVHAVAGVGHPAPFFAGLRESGLQVRAHALADHAPLDPAALPFPPGATVLMTEKDAVKCRSYAGADWWFVELEARLERTAADELLATILMRAGLTGAGVRLG